MHIFEQGGPIKKELPTARAARGIATEQRRKNEEIVTTSRVERWKFSGVIALSDCGLTVYKLKLSMKFLQPSIFFVFVILSMSDI